MRRFVTALRGLPRRVEWKVLATNAAVAASGAAAVCWWLETPPAVGALAVAAGVAVAAAAFQRDWLKPSTNRGGHADG